ncbi:MAG TPA: uracil phosphoribosyltransferase [Thermoflexales bacterium]|nr:uracil phosphoribosyltransferase [Thermoflexales bacterium]HQX12054.1 uracil phosphoribosyltransferase [Thermoflexales bacterium]HQY26008.1 uracil phosphoribosyltransferase [Thermoflexales bacterium]HQZ54324.1 uracil phosphoribosyltransferase [Thermoflexales bacterium]HRA55416.1 uracil phosphoribosyltransferase [Thermoflexales bacterium]
MPELHVSTHPLIRHKLAILRDKTTEPKKFRQLIREIAMMMLVDATVDMPTVEISVETPMGPAKGQRMGARLGLVPVLRAGLGMVDGVLEMVPYAQVWHIGLYRDEHTLRPVEYYNKLPIQPTVDVCLVLDPMLATGGSASATIDILKRWGARTIKYLGLIGAPEGVARLHADHPDVPIYLAALDERLNENGYILPGLGDAGDRQFGT